jgi:hypothetical protein
VIIAVEVDADRVNDDKCWMASPILGKSQWTRMDMWCGGVTWMNSRRKAWFDPDGPTTVKSTNPHSNNVKALLAQRKRFEGPKPALE